MRIRNVDKVKDLEKELGRYRKKVADQQKEIDGLKQRLLEALGGNSETNRAIDAILAQAALQHGERVKDEETGQELGWRLAFRMFRVSETLERYEVHTRRDEKTQEYIVGVIERKEKTQ